MNHYEQKLKQFIVDTNIDAEHLIFNRSCHSVKEAALVINANSEDFVKNICMISDNDDLDLVVVIVKGEDKVDKDKVAEIVKSKVRMAKPSEILERTGYPCGGTPSFGYEARFLIDDKVILKDFVYTGGGSEQSIVKISTKELLRVNRGEIVILRI